MAANMLTGGYEPVTIKMAVKGSDKIIEEPSIIAVRKSDDTVLAAGNDAERYINDESDDIVVICPFRKGAVADFDLAATLFKCLICTHYKRKAFFFRPSVVLCSRFEMTPVERIATLDMLRQAGAGKAQLADVSFEQGLREYSGNAIIIGME